MLRVAWQCAVILLLSALHTWSLDLPVHPRGGFRRATGRFERVASRRPAAGDAALPAAFDWRAVNGTNFLASNRNQHEPHYCGGCYAFSTTSTLSDRLRIAARGAWPEINIAPEYALSCDMFDWGCHGGDPWTLHEWIYNYGIVDETCCIFQATGYDSTGDACTPETTCGTCGPSGCGPVETHAYYTITEHGLVNGTANMMAEIYARGPIICTMAVTPAFLNYSGGVFYDHTNDTAVDHGVSVVGWGFDASVNLPYWSVRNSWGTWWGEHGFFRIVRGVNNVMIESDCQWSVPAPPSSPVGGGRASEHAVPPNTPPSKYTSATVLGYRPGPNAFAERITEPLPARPTTVPPAWDWRNVSGTVYVTWTKNQNLPRYCQSSWAQAPTSILSDRLLIKSGGQWPRINLSPQVMLNCGGGGDCSGGDPMDVYVYGHTTGLPDETCGQYAAEVKPCDAMGVCMDCHPINSSFTPGACNPVIVYPKWWVGDYGTVSGAENMQTEILTRGPIACGIGVTAGFEAYPGGIYQEASLQPVNAFVSVVGWGVDASSGVSYWIGRNSWGTAWGMHGYFYIKLGGDNLGIETNCSWGVPELSRVS